MNKISDNDKLEKAKQIHDDLEVDVACYNEHRQNLMHKDNRNGFSQLFCGGEAEVRSVVAHNTHEGKELRVECKKEAPPWRYSGN